MTRFLLVRHGTTDWVDVQLLHGISDVPLNDKGRLQAADVAAALKGCGAEKMYTSPLSRCAETAAIIGRSVNLEAIPLDELIEIDFGWLEGRKIRDHDSGEYGKFAEWIDNHIFNIVRTLSGENKKKFARRVLRGWSKIIKANPSGKVIIVAHSGVIGAILMNYFGKRYFNEGDRYYHSSPCSISEIEIIPSAEPKLIRLNDNSHISGKNR